MWTFSRAPLDVPPSRLGDRFHFGAVLHTAPEATPFGDRLAALPVSSLWSG